MRKIKRGTGFKGVCFYVQYGEGNVPGHGRWIGGTAAANDAAALAREFRAIANLRLDIEKPVWHNSLRMPKSEDVTDEKWVQISETYLEKMGFDLGKTQYKIGKHDDDEHIHIIANRVMTDGTIYFGQNENFRSTRAIEQLEQVYGLSITPSVNNTPPSRRSLPTRAEQEKAIRTGEKPVRLVLQEAVAAAIQGRPTTGVFLERLDAAGVESIPNIASTGLVNGFKFVLNGLSFSGSKLGNDFKWASILKGIDYEQDRDGEEIARRRNAALSGAANDGATEAASDAAKIIGSVIDSDVEIGVGDFANCPSVTGHHANVGIDRQALDVDRVDSATGQRGEACKTVSAFDGELYQGAGHGNQIASAKRVIEELAAPVERRDVASKISAWRKVHDALQARSYRLELKDCVLSDRDRSHNTGRAKDIYDQETLYDADLVESMIPDLSTKNAQGFDVYLTPIDDRFHYIIIDDLKPGAVDEMKSEGYKPALVQSLSEGNQQAIFKVSRERRKDDQQITEKLVSNLNKKYGDPKLTTVIHPFRMAGFNNKQSGRNNEFTKIVEAIGDVCSKAMDALSSLREMIDVEATAQIAELNKCERAETIKNFSKHAITGSTREYQQRAAFFIKIRKQPIDWAGVDFGVACEMYQRNFNTESITAALLEGSPGVAEHHDNSKNYIERILKAARQSVRADRESDSESAPVSEPPAPP